MSWLACTRRIDGVIEYLAVDRTAELRGALVAQARASLNVAAPDVHTAPPRGGLQLVGVPVWFWADHEAPRAATASVPGLSATVTATPGGLTITTTGPDGTTATRTCASGGTPWDPTRPGAEQHSDCREAFQVDGRVRVRATVRWTLRWRSSDGQTGTLPAIDRATAFALAVHQGQGVIDG